MTTKKPDRAAKIAEWTHTWHPAAFKGAMFDLKLARRIRRAIADAVKEAVAEKAETDAWYVDHMSTSYLNAAKTEVTEMNSVGCVMRYMARTIRKGSV